MFCAHLKLRPEAEQFYNHDPIPQAPAPSPERRPSSPLSTRSRSPRSPRSRSPNSPARSSARRDVGELDRAERDVVRPSLDPVLEQHFQKEFGKRSTTWSGKRITWSNLPDDTHAPKPATDASDPIDAYFDIDDTIECSGGGCSGFDIRYAKGAVYPGVHAFRAELTRGPGSRASILSARCSWLPKVGTTAVREKCQRWGCPEEGEEGAPQLLLGTLTSGVCGAVFGILNSFVRV